MTISMWPFKKKTKQDEYLTPRMQEHLETERRANEAAQALGRHYVDWVEPVKELKRQGELAEAERVLLACVDAVEREFAVTGFGVAPWYYEQLAVIYRKQERYADEVAILDRYVQHPSARKEALADRLVKASQLWARQAGTAK